MRPTAAGRLAVITAAACLALTLTALTAAPAAAAPAGPAASLRSAEQEDVTYYVVPTITDGEPEFLFEIAQRFLGDGNRYQEIFDLNEGRIQPDGLALTDPSVLLPGWVLVMPDGADGPGLESGPLPTALVTPRTPRLSPAPGSEESRAGTATPEDDGATSSAEPSGTEETSPGEAAGGGTSEGDGGSPVLLVVLALLVLAALAAGVWYLLRRRAAAAAEEPFDDSLLRPDTSSSWMVDRALRVLVASCERDGTDVPRLAGVFVEGSGLRLRLAGPVSPAPVPWVASEDGQSWAAPLARLQSAPASEEPTTRFARLVTVGMAETGRVLVDFSAARGTISLDGPTRAKHEVLRRWLGELTANPWSDDPRVVVVGNGMPQQESVEHLAHLEQLVPELESEGHGVLVLAQAPSTAQQAMLAQRFASPAFRWVVVVLGAVPTARWRFTVDGEGWLRSSFLPDVRYVDGPSARKGGK
ncbi:LysM peptidoglycan-binding domain-containing protein [Antribacter gilvus]|uniref:LysM peptidoglycan-binding domain-containing protein n=1 Tax=Antribacter gilvus TaxID=2304675 RepID=UPI000F7ADA21|nr:hypothetical protein [Antribacter gilvus]